MSYAIVGFGAVGQALARAFARKNIDVARQLGFAPINLGKLAEVARWCKRAAAPGLSSSSRTCSRRSSNRCTIV